MSLDLCRLCLKKDNLGPIFVDEGKSERYTTVLSLTTGLKIEPNDGLPQKICTECTSLVNSALHLRNTSFKSNKKLQKRKNYCKKENNPVSEDSFENNDTTEFEIQIQFDRLTEENEGRDNYLKNKQANEIADMQPINIKDDTVNIEKVSRKDKRKMYLQLVDGVFNPKGPVKCKVCKKTVSKWSCFISHAKLHLGFKYMCEFCGKSFISSTQLKRHCRSYHGMQRDLQCKHCSYLALDNAQLLLHERRIHTGERPYVCDVCAASYHSRRCLVQHLESHRAVADVQCDECEQTFKSNRHLAKHRYAAHGPARRVKCPQCHKAYCRKYISAHIAKHHPPYYNT